MQWPGGAAARPSSADGVEPPLSAAFQDTAFIRFVDEADMRREGNVTTPQQQQQLKQQQKAQVAGGTASAVLAPGGSGSAAPSKEPPQSASTDEDWDALDNIELDSQTMQQLVDTEEEFYATQMFMDSGLTQESDSGTKGLAASHGTGGWARPAAATVSVPATPTALGGAGKARRAAYGSDSEPMVRATSSGGEPAKRQGLCRAASAQGDGVMRRANLYPRLAAHAPLRTGDRTMGRPPVVPEIEKTRRAEPEAENMRLRSENERLRAAQEALQAQVYTKEGEATIVREKLARTEIENTRLQERIGGQVAAAAAAQSAAEKTLRDEIERLRTELLFQKHEAATLRQPVRSSPRTDSDRAGRSGAAERSRADTAPRGPDAAAVLGQLASTGASAEYGAVLGVAAQVARVVRDGEAKGLHTLACATLRNAAMRGRWRQVEATARLLERAMAQIDSVRTAWAGVQDDSACELWTTGATALGSAAAAASSADGSSRAAAAVARLLVRSAPAADATAWAALDVGALGRHAAGLTPGALAAVLDMVAATIRGSDSAWQAAYSDAAAFEKLLCGAAARLRQAYVRGEAGALRGQRAMLTLAAVALVRDADASRILFGAMPAFAKALVRGFLAEHAALAVLPAPPLPRVRVFAEHLRCLDAVLADATDAVALLGGDRAPTFCAFVAAATRLALGERAFRARPDIPAVAADLLAYAVTQDQATDIHGLSDPPD
ncbi:hypothetical protein GGF46_000568 [Coemansia sp. RSA 552]|nr:hypothetical protein GGF46_000568 [Coemansia sp. RSA 552]